MSFMEKIEAHARRSKLTILLDENLEGLKVGLKDAGFKVLEIKKGMSDDEIKEIAENTAVLTKNSTDFLKEAVRFDYDVISIEAIKFIDDAPNRKNKTVEKIANAIRESGFYNVRGNFNLKIFDDGKYEVVPLA